MRVNARDKEVSTMIISDKLPPKITQAYHSQVNQVEERRARSVQEAANPKGDEVSLSSEVHVLQKAKSVAMAAPEVRAERVAELKRLIAEGLYEVPLDGLVERLLKGDLVDENGERG